jgi:hypothetical protein
MLILGFKKQVYLSAKAQVNRYLLIVHNQTIFSN